MTESDKINDTKRALNEAGISSFTATGRVQGRGLAQGEKASGQNAEYDGAGDLLRATDRSDLEISRKRASLEAVMVPESVDDHLARFEAAGFRNAFRVEASLADPAADLRPGMEGVGKVEIGERRRVWIWTHDLLHWQRVWTWSWWP